MSEKENFFSLVNLDKGIARNLAPGLDTHVFPGDQAMLSIVDIAPNAEGSIHSHPEEQWGFLLKGSGVRIQNGERFEVSEGDFWRTPGNIEHTFIGGPEGARVLDIFAPPRQAYKNSGSGFE